MIFQQLVSGREWAVSGKIRAAQRAVDWLNNSVSRDPQNGQTFYGFQQFEQRRALDAVVVGRTAMYSNMSDESAPLEYIDPTALRFYRDKISLNVAGVPVEPRPDELVWQYQLARNFRAGEIFLDHLLPVGASFFQSPIVSVLRTARLFWLLQEHDSAALDGRKLRDVLIVGNESVQEAVTAAIMQQVAAWSGADPAKLRVPIISVNNPGGQPLENQFYSLGLSKIPESFNRELFTTFFVNQISAALGLAIRHFWNNEKSGGTNRSLEEVAEIRQQQKGPNLFIKSEERLINNSGVLARFGTGKNKVRFGFIEEFDLSSRVTNAEVLLKTTTAMAKVAAVFGQTISPESYLSWMQNLGVLPYELELQDVVATTTMMNPDNSSSVPGETAVTGNDSANAFNGQDQNTGGTVNTNVKNMFNIDYDEVAIDLHGNIVDKRIKVFSVLKLLTNAETAAAASVPAVLPADEDAFIQAIAAVSKSNREYFVENYKTYEKDILNWANFQVIRTPELSLGAITKTLNNESLTPEEQDVVDVLVDYIRDVWSAAGAA